MEEATELEYLKWFFENADFGPAHGDVMEEKNNEFEVQTGKSIPKPYLWS
jgi:hypothetical protein